MRRWIHFGGAGRVITHSADFDGSTGYFSRTPSAGTSRRQWAILTAIKRDTTGDDYICSIGAGPNDWPVRFNSSDKFNFSIGNPTAGQLLTTATYSTGVWKFFYSYWDSPNGTAGDRMRLFDESGEITAFDTDSNPTQNTDSTWNTAAAHNIGRSSAGANYADMKMATWAFFDGSPPAWSSLFSGGKMVDLGPIFAARSGINDCWLRFQDSGALGTDSSGRGNDWTVNGTITQSTDVPT